MRSPEYVQMSTAAAITLGVMPGRMYRTDCTHCLNLLLTYPEGCRANCAYCGLARHREETRDYADRNFIRVGWPALRYREVIERVRAGGDGRTREEAIKPAAGCADVGAASAVHVRLKPDLQLEAPNGCFQRMCLSMVSHPDSNRDTLALLTQWVRELPQIPVSILSNPTTMGRDDLVRLKQAGAEIFTVALDAVTPEIFERTRGKAVDSPHRWEKYWQAIAWAAEIFGPEKFGAHLICGMGETEHELLEVVQRIKGLGGHSHLFAFFPEKGSLMEDWPACGKAQWRRVQLARYLIDHAGGDFGRMAFDEAGRVADFGVAASELEQIINAGTPFRTSGCPGKDAAEISACNRPYGDSHPSDILSYPFKLNSEDIEMVQLQLREERGKTFFD